jgi:hypothetical protein
LSDSDTLRAVAALAVAAVHFNQIELWLEGDHNTTLALYCLASGTTFLPGRTTTLGRRRPPSVWAVSGCDLSVVLRMPLDSCCGPISTMRSAELARTLSAVRG